MPSLAELESKFDELTALREAAKYDRDLHPEKPLQLAAEHRAVHTQLFAARKEAAAAAAGTCPHSSTVWFIRINSHDYQRVILLRRNPNWSAFLP